MVCPSGVTQSLATDLLSIKTLNQRDKEQLIKLILDFFAASLAGYRLNRSFNTAVEKVCLAHGGAQQSSIMFENSKYPAHTAAFINAMYAHGAELDDGNRKAMGHVGVHVIPATFAVAEMLRSTSEDVLIALATGYEAYIRISSAAQPGMVKRGFHSTGMAGALAAASACARLYGMDAQGIEDSIALATTMSGGLLSYGDSRPAIKPINPARAAEAGVLATMLVSEGVRGPEEALEGPNGWFHAVTDEVHWSMLEGADHLLLHDCYIKLYPSCRHTHCGIEAAELIHGRLLGRKVKHVQVFIYPNAIKLAGQIAFPKDQDETKFSIQYTLATALANGAYGVADMDVNKAPNSVWKLVSVTELIPDDTLEDRLRGIRGARVEVELEDGTVETETVLVPKGDPEKPLSMEDVIEKLHGCATDFVASDKVDKLIAAVKELCEKDIFENPIVCLEGE